MEKCTCLIYTVIHKQMNKRQTDFIASIVNLSLKASKCSNAKLIGINKIVALIFPSLYVLIMIVF